MNCLGKCPQIETPNWIYQRPVRCPDRWHSEEILTDVPLKNTLQMKWSERGTFFIRNRNENVPKKMNLGVGSGLWLSRLIYST